MRPAFIFIATVCCNLINGQLTESTESAPLLSAVGSLGLELMNQMNTCQQNQMPLEKIIQDGFLRIGQLEENLNIKTITIVNQIERYLLQTATIEEIHVYVSEKYSLNEFNNSSERIDRLYRQFESNINPVINNHSLVAFAEDIVSACTDDLSMMIRTIYRSRYDLFRVLVKQHEAQDVAKICGTSSPQQQIYGVFNVIALNMVKGYVMLTYADHLLDKFDEDDSYVVNRLYSEGYQNKMIEIEHAAWAAMSNVSRDFRPCDPENHEEGKTFMQLKWLFNAVVINEIYLNPEGSCWETCPSYQKATTYPSNWKIPPRDTCNGTLYGCFTSKWDHYCPSTQPHRRYDGFKGHTHIFTSDVPDSGKASCQGDPLWSTPEPEAGFFSRCDDCVCYCDDINNADTLRTFSTRMVTADSNDNRVITGLRLVELQRVIHIQVQEGKLGPNGVIDNATVRWKPIEELDHTDPSTPSSDYFTITMDRNQIYFSTITAPPGHVVTGVAFDSKGDGIALRIEVVAINATTGNVTNRPTFMKIPDRVRTKLQLDAPHIPTLAEGENLANTTNNLYLGFRQTDWGKDSAQTAIPYIDIQPIVTHPPTLLSGVGMVHKGQAGYGGFLGMKLVTYDYRDFVKSGSGDVMGFS